MTIEYHSNVAKHYPPPPTLGKTQKNHNILLWASMSTILSNFNYKYITHMKDKKTKKPRDVSYSQGYKLIQKHGYETVKTM